MPYSLLSATPHRLVFWLKHRIVSSLVVGTLVFGVGCGSTQTAATPPLPPSDSAGTDAVAAEVSMPDPRSQRLPVTAATTLGGQEIFLEVAATPEQQSLGLMYRNALPDDRGMVFPLRQPRPVTFWMKNVPVPLDMVFVYDGTIQAIAANVPPCSAEPCPTYGPGGQLIDHVIELRAGRAAELGLAVGDEVVIRPLNP